METCDWGLKYRYDDASVDNETGKNAKLNSLLLKIILKRKWYSYDSYDRVLFNLFGKLFSYLKIVRLIAALVSVYRMIRWWLYLLPHFKPQMFISGLTPYPY
jgi:hypothetical protein